MKIKDNFSKKKFIVKKNNYKKKTNERNFKFVMGFIVLVLVVLGAVVFYNIFNKNTSNTTTTITENKNKFISPITTEQKMTVKKEGQEIFNHSSLEDILNLNPSQSAEIHQLINPTIEKRKVIIEDRHEIIKVFRKEEIQIQAQAENNYIKKIKEKNDEETKKIKDSSDKTDKLIRKLEDKTIQDDKLIRDIKDQKRKEDKRIKSIEDKKRKKKNEKLVNQIKEEEVKRIQEVKDQKDEKRKEDKKIKAIKDQKNQKIQEAKEKEDERRKEDARIKAIEDKKIKETEEKEVKRRQEKTENKRRKEKKEKKDKKILKLNINNIKKKKETNAKKILILKKNIKIMGLGFLKQFSGLNSLTSLQVHNNNFVKFLDNSSLLNPLTIYNNKTSTKLLKIAKKKEEKTIAKKKKQKINSYQYQEEKESNDKSKKSKDVLFNNVNEHVLFNKLNTFLFSSIDDKIFLDSNKELINQYQKNLLLDFKLVNLIKESNFIDYFFLKFKTVLNLKNISKTEITSFFSMVINNEHIEEDYKILLVFYLHSIFLNFSAEVKKSLKIKNTKFVLNEQKKYYNKDNFNWISKDFDDIKETSLYLLSVFFFNIENLKAEYNDFIDTQLSNKGLGLSLEEIKKYRLIGNTVFNNKDGNILRFLRFLDLIHEENFQENLLLFLYNKFLILILTNEVSLFNFFSFFNFSSLKKLKTVHDKIFYFFLIAIKINFFHNEEFLIMKKGFLKEKQKTTIDQLLNCLIDINVSEYRVLLDNFHVRQKDFQFLKSIYFLNNLFLVVSNNNLDTPKLQFKSYFQEYILYINAITNYQVTYKVLHDRININYKSLLNLFNNKNLVLNFTKIYKVQKSSLNSNYFISLKKSLKTNDFSKSLKFLFCLYSLIEYAQKLQLKVLLDKISSTDKLLLYNYFKDLDSDSKEVFQEILNKSKNWFFTSNKELTKQQKNLLKLKQFSWLKKFFEKFQLKENIFNYIEVLKILKLFFDTDSTKKTVQLTIEELEFLFKKHYDFAFNYYNPMILLIFKNNSFFLENLTPWIKVENFKNLLNDKERLLDFYFVYLKELLFFIKNHKPLMSALNFCFKKIDVFQISDASNNNVKNGILKNYLKKISNKEHENELLIKNIKKTKNFFYYQYLDELNLYMENFIDHGLRIIGSLKRKKSDGSSNIKNVISSIKLSISELEKSKNKEERVSSEYKNTLLTSLINYYGVLLVSLMKNKKSMIVLLDHKSSKYFFLPEQDDFLIDSSSCKKIKIFLNKIEDDLFGHFKLNSANLNKKIENFKLSKTFFLSYESLYYIFQEKFKYFFAQCNFNLLLNKNAKQQEDLLLKDDLFLSFCHQNSLIVSKKDNYKENIRLFYQLNKFYLFNVHAYNFLFYSLAQSLKKKSLKDIKKSSLDEINLFNFLTLGEIKKNFSTLSNDCFNTEVINQFNTFSDTLVFSNGLKQYLQEYLIKPSEEIFKAYQNENKQDNMIWASLFMKEKIDIKTLLEVMNVLNCSECKLWLMDCKKLNIKSELKKLFYFVQENFWKNETITTHMLVNNNWELKINFIDSFIQNLQIGRVFFYNLKDDDFLARHHLTISNKQEFNKVIKILFSHKFPWLLGGDFFLLEEKEQSGHAFDHLQYECLLLIFLYLIEIRDAMLTFDGFIFSKKAILKDINDMHKRLEKIIGVQNKASMIFFLDLHKGWTNHYFFISSMSSWFLADTPIDSILNCDFKVYFSLKKLLYFFNNFSVLENYTHFFLDNLKENFKNYNFKTVDNCNTNNYFNTDLSPFNFDVILQKDPLNDKKLFKMNKSSALEFSVDLFMNLMNTNILNKNYIPPLISKNERMCQTQKEKTFFIIKTLQNSVSFNYKKNNSTIVSLETMDSHFNSFFYNFKQILNFGDNFLNFFLFKNVNEKDNNKKDFFSFQNQFIFITKFLPCSYAYFSKFFDLRFFLNTAIISSFQSIFYLKTEEEDFFSSLNDSFYSGFKNFKEQSFFSQKEKLERNFFHSITQKQYLEYFNTLNSGILFYNQFYLQLNQIVYKLYYLDNSSFDKFPFSKIEINTKNFYNILKV